MSPDVLVEYAWLSTDHLTKGTHISFPIWRIVFFCRHRRRRRLRKWWRLKCRWRWRRRLKRRCCRRLKVARNVGLVATLWRHRRCCGLLLHETQRAVLQRKVVHKRRGLLWRHRNLMWCAWRGCFSRFQRSWRRHLFELFVHVLALALFPSLLNRFDRRCGLNGSFFFLFFSGTFQRWARFLWRSRRWRCRRSRIGRFSVGHVCSGRNSGRLAAWKIESSHVWETDRSMVKHKN